VNPTPLDSTDTTALIHHTEEEGTEGITDHHTPLMDVTTEATESMNDPTHQAAHRMIRVADMTVGMALRDSLSRTEEVGWEGLWACRIRVVWILCSLVIQDMG
jgi:hypothetical protein